jgi:predicted glycosyltransferase
MLRYCLKHRPDVILGIVAIRGSHIGWLLGIKTIVFTDTEHATKQIAIFKPFATEIHTPNWFGMELGDKQHRYSGFHELAYLHPDNFSPREEVLDLLGVSAGEPYFILRFIGWDATHDVGQSGISLANKRELVKQLLPYGQVFITSEYELEEEFKQYEYNIPKSYLHDALSYCTILIGEGATTACEASMLGVPNILINTMLWGYITYLEEEYDLLYHLTDQGSLLDKLQMLLANTNLKAEWQTKRETFLATQQDTTAYIVDLIKAGAK